jgi:hypothetical protein
MPLTAAALKAACPDEAKLLAIAKIEARMILDSRGNPTVEVDLTTEVSLSATLATLVPTCPKEWSAWC